LTETETETETRSGVTASKGRARRISCVSIIPDFRKKHTFCQVILTVRCTHSSIIVDDLQTQTTRAQAQTQTQTQSTPVAFFYLSHADRQAQTSHAVLSCLLRQVLEQVPSLPETVRAVYDTAQAKGGGALSAFECERLLAEVLGELPRAYLVLDALDECADEHRGSLLRTLGQLGQLRGVRVLVTSRPHVKFVSLLPPIPKGETK